LLLSSNLQRWAITFFRSPQMTNPQLLGLIPQSPIRNFYALSTKF
jgi:hypothetical protein